MKTTTKMTSKVITGKVSTVTGKVAFLFILMVNFTINFFSSLSAKIRKNAEKISDFTGAPVDEWNDFAGFLEKKNTYEKVSMSPFTVEKLYELSYLLILYSVRTSIVFNVVTVCLLMLSSPFKLSAQILGAISRNNPGVIVSLNPVQTLTTINGVIVTNLSDGKWAQSIKDKFSAKLKKIVAEIAETAPFVGELNLNTITLTDVQVFLGKVISDSVTVEEALVTEMITKRKEELANVIGCTVGGVLAYVEYRKNPTMTTTSEKYALAKKVETAFKQNGLTSEWILGFRTLSTNSPVSEN